MGYIEQTDIGNVYVTDINDWFATLSNLNSECKNYTDSEIRYKEIVAEHDKQIIAEVIKDSFLKDCESCEAHLREQIRAEVIEEFVKWAYIHGIDFSFMGKIKEDGKSDVPQRLQNIKDRFYNELKENK